MSTNGYLKKICGRACVYYTVTTFVLILFSWLISGNVGNFMHPISLMLVYPFSAFFAAANLIFREGSMGTAGKVFSHYALLFSGIFFFLYLPNKTSSQKASGALLLFLLLTVIYAMIMGIILYFKGRNQKLTRDQSTYTSVYKNKK